MSLDKKDQVVHVVKDKATVITLASSESMMAQLPAEHVDGHIPNLGSRMDVPFTYVFDIASRTLVLRNACTEPSVTSVDQDGVPYGTFQMLKHPKEGGGALNVTNGVVCDKDQTVKIKELKQAIVRDSNATIVPVAPKVVHQHCKPRQMRLVNMMDRPLCMQLSIDANVLSIEFRRASTSSSSPSSSHSSSSEATMSEA